MEREGDCEGENCNCQIGIDLSVKREVDSSFICEQSTFLFQCHSICKLCHFIFKVDADTK